MKPDLKTPGDPLLLPLVMIAGGIVLSRWVRFDRGETGAALATLLALTLVAARSGRRAAYFSCLITLGFLGIFADTVHRPKGLPTIDAQSGELVLLGGCVVEPSIFYEGRDQFTLELAPAANARVTLNLKDGEAPPELRYGQSVEFEGKVRPIHNYRNPGSFDFEAYSTRRHVFWNASVASGGTVRVLPERCGSRFWGAIFGLRTLTLKRIEALFPGNPYAIGMMEAILIGETTKLEKVWTEHFRRTGTFHALVISGMHISVLAGTLLFLLRICFIPEMPALAATALSAWLYALVSGWSAPAVRAAGAFSLYLVGRYFYRQRRLVNLLAAVAIGYLLYDPGQLFESSFQLSFLSVLALAVLAVPLLKATSAPLNAGLNNLQEKSRDPGLAPRSARLRLEIRLLAETALLCLGIPQRWSERVLAAMLRLSLYIYEMVVISTVIQIGLALPMAIYFHRISFSGLSANVIIVPLLSLVIPIGFFAVFTGWQWTGNVAAFLLGLAEKVANWHGRWEPDRRVADPPTWLAIAFVAALIAVAFAMQRSWRLTLPAVATVLALFALLFLHPFPAEVQRGVLELSAVDVGQGDGLLVTFPDGKVMLIDGGGFPAFARLKHKPRLDIGEDVVSPYLWSRGIQRVDVAVCTHAHEDHTGGLGALIDNFHPSELWSGANGASLVWQELREKANRRHVTIRELRCCQTMAFGGTTVQILSPPTDYEPADDAKNDDSLAFRITYGKHSFLLTGDMEKSMEARLLSDGHLAHADVLKVGHHGSKTSSSDFFLDAVKPEFAVISDGFENSFHHPHPSVLARLKERHTAIFRTDQLGLVTIRSDGRRLWTETQVGREPTLLLNY